MKHRFKILAAVTLGVGAASSSAHIGYTGRDFGTLVNGSQVTIASQAVTGNFGWADAADATLVFDASLGDTTGTAGVDNLYLGDSHKARAFRLHLDSALTVSFTAAAHATATSSSIGGLLPGFTVYQGLAAVAPYTAPQSGADHDGSAASMAWRTSWAQSNVGVGLDYTATQGSWNAKGDWQLGGDGDPAGVAGALSSFHFVGYAVDTDRDGVATGKFLLGPGDYSLFVGGSDITNKGSLNFNRAYGLSMTVSAVPEPQSWLLMLLGVPLLAWRRQRARGLPSPT